MVRTCAWMGGLFCAPPRGLDDTAAAVVGVLVAILTVGFVVVISYILVTKSKSMEISLLDESEEERARPNTPPLETYGAMES